MNKKSQATSYKSKVPGMNLPARIVSTSNFQPSTFNLHSAFTLIELLVVIAVIAILAAFILPAASIAKRHSIITHAQAEMNQLETALDSYKAAYGFYPPGRPSYPSDSQYSSINQLYFELSGTTNDAGIYWTLDRNASISPDAVKFFFGVDGFVNCDSTNSQSARDFLSGLKPNQYRSYTNDPSSGYTNTVLISSVGLPDSGPGYGNPPVPNYEPLGVPDLNPWRYRFPGVKNPNGYDLWIDLAIGGKINRISNWDKRVEIVSEPLP